jgi:hypothetical protein
VSGPRAIFVTVASAREQAGRLADLLRAEHGGMADFLVALAEFDRRRAWVELGYASLFLFLQRGLGLSASTAHFRQKAAQLVLRFPRVVEPLRDGRLCITTVFELAKVLTEENEAEVLPRFFRCSKDEAMAIVADLRPAPAVPQRPVVRALPAPAARAPPHDAPQLQPAEATVNKPVPGDGTSRAAGTSPPARPWPAAHGGAAPAASSGSPAAAGSVSPPGASASAGSVTPQGSTGALPPRSDAPPDPPGPGVAAPTEPGAGVPPASPAPFALAAQPPRDELTPLTRDRARLHVTVTRAFVGKLEAAQHALSHARPRAGAGELLEVGLDLILAGHARRRGLVARPRPPRPPEALKDGGVPAWVRREVWRRDRGCCQWPLEAGGVCGSRLRVELDHVKAKALGGKATVAGMRLLCRFHNQLAAREAFGDAWMDRYTRDPRVSEEGVGYAP